jgi:hypothetical protein
MRADRSVVWSPGIVFCLFLHAPLAAAQSDSGRQAEAMAFIRVVADVRVDFGGTRPAVERKGLELATGSGFVVAPSGLLLTSLHVVADDEAKDRFREDEAEVSIENRRIEVAIGRGGGEGVFEAHVVASDVGNDLAALQVTAGDLPYLPLGDSDAVEPGRPVQVLGFPFGRQIDVGRRADASLVPEVTVTAGSFSAARANEEGETRFLQTDATINPGNSGGPMLDEDGYVVGVVKMKLARDAASQGAGFSVPVNLAKDFLEANGLLGLLPVVRLRAGVRHTVDWKGIAIDLPDGYSDQSTSRIVADGGEIGEVGFRAYRLATAWPVAALEEVLLGGREVPGFVPAPASAGRRQASGRRALSSGVAPTVIVSAAGTDASGSAFRAEYAIVDRKNEKIVARFLGPADAVAFNLGLIRRSLGSLEAAPMLLDAPPGSLGAEAPALENVSFPEGEGRVLAPAGWLREPASQSACGRLPPPESGLAASPPRDYTLVLRALRWTTGGPGLEEALRACGQGAGRAAGPSTAEVPRYALRFERLGVPIEARGLLVKHGSESLLLELEAPVAKLPIVEGLYERWTREVTAGR